MTRAPGPRGGRRRRMLPFLGLLTLLAALTTAAPVHASGPRVLLVGTYHGIPGQYATIQAAVDASNPGDWILVGPGDYHERGRMATDDPSGVWITTPNLHLRGMNRNTVIVDGTRPDAPKPCDGARGSQFLGPMDAHHHRLGMNGIVAYEASGVSIQNLTVCNYLITSHGGTGNEIWWNGGDGSGKIGLHSYRGSYLTASSTYANGFGKPRGEYGIFMSNANGPGTVTNSYASNMGDAGFYLGACPNCRAVIDHVRSQNNSDGYSGTNSGGHVVVENSEFDHNKTGASTDSENNDDIPSPQDGRCPHGQTGPTGTKSCWVWRNNFMHDNNNPNVPGSGQGTAGSAPIGTGFILAGGRHDTFIHNRFEDNGAWGFLIVDFPYVGTPPPGAHCQGGTPAPGDVCYYNAFGSETTTNVFKHNGFLGNETNVDMAMATQVHSPGNCFHRNTDPKGVSTDPPNMQQAPYRHCGDANGGDTGPLVAEVACATQLFAPCPSNPSANYPRPTKVYLRPIPVLPTMPDPCANVPSNPWCP